MKPCNWRTRKARNQDMRSRRSGLKGQTSDYMGQYLITAAKRGEKVQRSLLQKMTGGMR